MLDTEARRERSQVGSIQASRIAGVLPASGENREVVDPLMGESTMEVKAGTTSIHQRYGAGGPGACSIVRRRSLGLLQVASARSRSATKLARSSAGSTSVAGEGLSR